MGFKTQRDVPKAKRVVRYNPKLFMMFDPGGTTGFAIGWHTGDFAFYLDESGEISWSDRYAVSDIITRLIPEAKRMDRTLMVFAEDFKPDKGAIAALAGRHVLASEVIGMIDLTCQQAGVLFLRQPRWCKGSVQVLPQHVNQVGSSQHRIDSYCHLRYRIIEDVQAFKRANK